MGYHMVMRTRAGARLGSPRLGHPASRAWLGSVISRAVERGSAREPQLVIAYLHHIHRFTDHIQECNHIKILTVPHKDFNSTISRF